MQGRLCNVAAGCASAQPAAARIRNRWIRARGHRKQQMPCVPFLFSELRLMFPLPEYQFRCFPRRKLAAAGPSHSGHHKVTQAAWAAGRSAFAYEIKFDRKGMDLTSDTGFANAVYQCLRLQHGGSALLAPVCSSWVPINRYTSGRSPEHPWVWLRTHVQGWTLNSNIRATSVGDR